MQGALPIEVPGRTGGGRARALAGLAVCAAVVAALAGSGQPAMPVVEPLRIATFNIEDFPKNQRQIDGAFALIAGLEADAVAVQEITDPAAFIGAARRRLGRAWQFVHVDTMPPDTIHPPMHVGVLYDGGRHTLVSVTIHPQTTLGRRHKPTLEVRLRPAAGGPVTQLFVVHFKSGSAGRSVREAQHDALARLIDDARRPGERAMVMGDFNATEPDDRTDLALLAARTGLQWATEALPCSAYWRRADDCATSRLDHVLTWARPDAVVAHGACATVGCAVADSCPRYRDEISDHCPVTVTFAAGR